MSFDQQDLNYRSRNSVASNPRTGSHTGADISNLQRRTSLGERRVSGALGGRSRSPIRNTVAYGDSYTENPG